MTSPTPAVQTSATEPQRSPWPALWALLIGFFMLLVDTTIVSVANPAIKAALDPNTSNLDNVVWVTSAYLLTYAVPLLVAGRLGDRFGPKNIYLIGLVIFTASSLACGLSSSLGMLIAARALQGLGAALMTPQTMSVITRTFPPARRGAAMGLWGAASGVATLVGPLAGGVLVDGPGWEWIFFVNVPVGVIAFIAAWMLVPSFETRPHAFDIPGVIVSGIALFLIVFGLQEGETFDWTWWIWALVLAGVILMAVFVFMQGRSRREPLVPLSLFRDRNFSISNIGIATVGFAITSMTLPLMFFAQLARGLTPTESALMMIPMALTSGVIAPFAGRLLDRIDPRFLLVPGLSLVALSLFAFSATMTVDTPLWVYYLIAGVMGVGQAGMWGPLATTANRDLDPRAAGAGSGVYNTTRTIGAVVGSAAIAGLMQARLTANLPAAGGSGVSEFSTGQLPPAIAGEFSTAMAQTMLLPAGVLVLGVIAVCFLRRSAALPPVARRTR